MTTSQRLLTLLAVASLAAQRARPGRRRRRRRRRRQRGARRRGHAGEPTEAAVETYPRDETIYTTGKQWGPPSTWNPLDPNAAMGVVGLQYETLFLYDPLADKFDPWLAESASWTDRPPTRSRSARA